MENTIKKYPHIGRYTFTIVVSQKHQEDLSSYFCGMLQEEEEQAEEWGGYRCEVLAEIPSEPLNRQSIKKVYYARKNNETI